MKKNKKIIGIVVCIFLILIIILSFIKFETRGNDDVEKIIDSKSLKVDTREIKGDKVSNSLYPYYENKTLKKVTLNDFDIKRRNLYEFNVPIDLIEMYFSDFGKTLTNDNIKLEIYIEKDFDVEKYIKESVESFKNSGYPQVNYSENKKLKCNDYNCGYIKISAKSYESLTNSSNSYIERFIFYIKIDEYYYLYKLEIVDMKLSDELLTKIINSINIIKDGAKYTYTNHDENLIYGEIKQTEKSHLYWYGINYTLPYSKYKEIESVDSNVYSHKFQMGDDYTFNIRIFTTDSDVIDYIKNYNNLSKDFTLESNSSEQVTYKNKKYTILKSKYKPKSTDDFLYIYNIIYKIEDGYAFNINISTSKELNINELMQDFDCKIEKYDNVPLVEKK